MSKRKQFGLYSAGIGGGISALALLTDTAEMPILIASAVLVGIGVYTFVT